jgi:hypothetical protein
MPLTDSYPHWLREEWVSLKNALALGLSPNEIAR